MQTNLSIHPPRVFSVLLLLSATLSVRSQKIEKYYDYDWKETTVDKARFYSLIEKTDTGWRRLDYFIHGFTLQMAGLYADSSCKIPNGHFVYFHPNKMIESFGSYLNGKKQGLWIGAYSNGAMEDSTYYENGDPRGVSYKWHRNGNMADSAVYAPDGSGVAISWFDNGNPSSAGRYGPGYKPIGKWKYFHSNGQLSANEYYEDGEIVNKEYFDEEGKAMAYITSGDTGPVFPGGQKAWLKYLTRNIYFPPHYKITNSDQAAVVITATVDESGNLKDVEVTTPFEPPFDKIALETVKKSPRWIPAMKHNRKESNTIHQPVVFSQVE